MKEPMWSFSMPCTLRIASCSAVSSLCSDNVLQIPVLGKQTGRFAWCSREGGLPTASDRRHFALLSVVTVMWSKHFNPALSRPGLMLFFFHTVMCRGTNPDWLLIALVIPQTSPSPNQWLCQGVRCQVGMGCAPSMELGHPELCSTCCAVCL